MEITNALTIYANTFKDKIVSFSRLGILIVRIKLFTAAPLFVVLMLAVLLLMTCLF